MQTYSFSICDRALRIGANPESFVRIRHRSETVADSQPSSHRIGERLFMVASLNEGPSSNKKLLVGVSQSTRSMEKKRMKEASHLSRRGVSARQSRERLGSARINRKGIETDRRDEGTAGNMSFEGEKRRMLGVLPHKAMMEASVSDSDSDFTISRCERPGLWVIRVSSSLLCLWGYWENLYQPSSCPAI